MDNVNRREFLKYATMSGSGVVSAGLMTASSNSRIRGANDDVRVAVVGIGSNIKIGGKGKQDLRHFLKIPGVRVVAVCDPDQEIMDAEVSKLKADNVHVKPYVDMRDLLEDKSIDAVCVTTPNHWHALATVWACQAGKDVYVQKPTSHNIFEGRKMVEAASKFDRIVQAPQNPRNNNGYIEAFEYARAGNFGKILYVHGINYRARRSIGKVRQPTPVPKTMDYDLWSGPAPVLPVMREYLHYDWHWDWNYGDGDLGNMGIHSMDGCRIAVGHDKLPEHVISIGGRFGYDDDGHTPNTLISYFDYKPAPIIFEVRGMPKDEGWRSQNWERKARISVDYYRGHSWGIVVHCEGGYVAMNQAFDENGRLLETFESDRDELMANFIKVTRSRKSEDQTAPVLDGHLSSALVHMANISYRAGKETGENETRETASGQKDFLNSFERLRDHLFANRIDLKKTPLKLGAWLTMNPATERFIGEYSDKANEHAVGQYRKPFVVPEKV